MDTAFTINLQKTGEYGIVVQVSHPIVFIEGLPSVKTREVILFEGGQKGEVFNRHLGALCAIKRVALEGDPDRFHEQIGGHAGHSEFERFLSGSVQAEDLGSEVMASRACDQLQGCRGRRSFARFQPELNPAAIG